MPEQTAKPRIQEQINSFVMSLSEVKSLDPEVVALIQQLHQRDRLDSRNLLKEFGHQRQEWDDDKAA